MSRRRKSDRLFVLEENPYLEKIHVIIVNDGSTDGTTEILEQLSKELPSKSKKFEWKFLNHETNMGKGKSIETALIGLYPGFPISKKLLKSVWY